MCETNSLNRVQKYKDSGQSVVSLESLPPRVLTFNVLPARRYVCAWNRESCCCSCCGFESCTKAFSSGKTSWGNQLGETILGKPFWGNQLGETILGKPFGGNHPRIPHFSHLTKLTRIMVTFRPLLHQWLKTRI